MLNNNFPLSSFLSVPLRKISLPGNFSSEEYQQSPVSFENPNLNLKSIYLELMLNLSSVEPTSVQACQNHRLKKTDQSTKR